MTVNAPKMAFRLRSMAVNLAWTDAVAQALADPELPVTPHAIPHLLARAQAEATGDAPPGATAELLLRLTQ